MDLATGSLPILRFRFLIIFLLASWKNPQFLTGHYSHGHTVKNSDPSKIVPKRLRSLF